MKKEDVARAIYAQRSYTNAEIAQYYNIPVEELVKAIEDYRAGKVEEETEPKPKPRGKKKTA